MVASQADNELRCVAETPCDIAIRGHDRGFRFVLALIGQARGGHARECVPRRSETGEIEEERLGLCACINTGRIQLQEKWARVSQCSRINTLEVSDSNQDIQDRLRRQAVNCRTAYVVDTERVRSERLTEFGRGMLEQARPLLIIGNDSGRPALQT